MVAPVVVAVVVAVAFAAVVVTAMWLDLKNSNQRTARPTTETDGKMNGRYSLN
jgi:predicted outer membrane lipoprotein